VTPSTRPISFNYNCVSPGLVLRMVVRSYKALEPSELVSQFSPSHKPFKLTPARQSILDKGGPFPARASEIADRAGISAGVVRGMANAGGLDVRQLPVDAPFDDPHPDFGGITLSQAQIAAGQEIASQVSQRDFTVSLLDGVTGSGKTEVYFEGVAEALRTGGQCLILVPEIALTQAGMARFEARFGAAPAPWHSALGDAARRRTWREVAQGRAKLVVGARSALYLPFPDLRLIVVDEEHDTKAGDQAMLYLNRRGYAPLIICSACGEKLKSPDTDSWLVAHRRTGRAMCHMTGFSMPMPQACPQCKTDDSLTNVGPGVERVAEEAARHFPGAKVEIFSSDTAGNPAEIAARMHRMESGQIDILIGTQMVVKGHNFPHLTFVGVVDGDLGLSGGDPRAGERTYQTLVQVAGRAGRAAKSGHALIQTHQPDHEALIALAAGDRERFISAELASRDMLGLPPYGKLAAVIVSGLGEKETEALAKKFVSLAPRADGIEILGPSEPPIGRLRGLFRRRILVQAEASVNLSKYMSVWRKKIRVPSRYKLHIDIDPQSFM